MLEHELTGGIPDVVAVDTARVLSDFDAKVRLLFLLILLVLKFTLLLFVVIPLWLLVSLSEADRRSVLADVSCKGKPFSGELELQELLKSLGDTGASGDSRLITAG